MKQHVFATLLLLALGGCAAGGERMTGFPSTGQPALANQSRKAMGFRKFMTLANVRRGDPLAAPYSISSANYIPSHVSFPGAFTTTESLASSPHMKSLLRGFSSARRVRTPDESVYGDDQGGQAGFYVNATSANGNGSLWVAQSYNFEDDIYVDPPQDSYGNYLYAPTSHGPNGNCLESTTDYFDNTAGDSGTYFQIADFCQSPGNIVYYHIPIDDNFVQSYVEVYSNGDGDPEYQEEVLLGTDNRWHQLLYDNLSQQYLDLYDSVAAKANIQGLGQVGWSLFETHFSDGTTCPTFSRISDSGLRVQVTAGNENGNGGTGWEFAPNITWEQPTVGGVDASGDPNGNTDPYCFDPSNPPYYTFEENTSDLGFYVVDPKTKPTPSPKPTPIRTPTPCEAVVSKESTPGVAPPPCN